MSDYQRRVLRLQHRMREEGIGVTIIGDSDQMLYLTGWREVGHERFLGLFIPAESEPVFLVPALNAGQACANPAHIERVLGWNDAAGWQDTAQEILEELDTAGRQVLVDNELFTVHTLSLQKLLPGLKFAPAGPMMSLLREFKTESELEHLQRAAEMIDQVVEAVAARLYTGITEVEAQELVLQETRRLDSEPSFTPLICFGENGANPHNHSGGRDLRPGDVVVIDIGCKEGGYCSDTTRTFSYGPPSDPAAAAVYEIVSKAHLAAIAAVKPGSTGDAVDRAARSVIEAAGYGKQFMHRTGHGIGISVHEDPNMVEGNLAPLQAGMCFSIEPGIYLAGRFRVRIENIVTVTEDGVRSLNGAAPTALRILEPKAG